MEHLIHNFFFFFKKKEKVKIITSFSKKESYNSSISHLADLPKTKQKTVNNVIENKFPVISSTRWHFGLIIIVLTGGKKKLNRPILWFDTDSSSRPLSRSISCLELDASSSYFAIVLSKTWNISSAAAVSRSFTTALKRSRVDILSLLQYECEWPQEGVLWRQFRLELA